MTGAARPAVVGLAVLLRELRTDRAAMTRHAATCADLATTWEAQQRDPRSLIVAAHAMHGWYTALETLCERALRGIDASVPQGEKWHAELIAQAMTPIDGLRPAVVDASLQIELGRLRAFRHFYRNAYAVELDPVLLEDNLRRVGALTPDVETSLGSFFEFIEATIAALNRS